MISLSLPRAPSRQSERLKIHTASDIPDALTHSIDKGGLILDESQLSADFFDLRTGLAGEVLQKFTQYRALLAIVVTDPHAHGSRFGELIHEHRTHRKESQGMSKVHEHTLASAVPTHPDKC